MNWFANIAIGASKNRSIYAVWSMKRIYLLPQSHGQQSNVYYLLFMAFDIAQRH